MLKQLFARRQKNCFAACNRLNWPWGCSQKRMKMDNFMKIRIALGLCVVLGAGFISVRAADTPAQAAARAALEQKLNQSGRFANPVAAGNEHTFRGRGGTTRQIRNQCNRDGSRKSGDSANRPGGNNSGGCSRCCHTGCCCSCCCQSCCCRCSVLLPLLRLLLLPCRS